MQMKITGIHKIRGNSLSATITYFHLLCNFLGGQQALLLLFCKVYDKVYDNLQVSSNRNVVSYLQFSPSPRK